MPHALALLHYSASCRPAPGSVRDFASRSGFEVVELCSRQEVAVAVSRSYPAAVIVDGAEPVAEALELCRQMKAEAFTAVVPVIVYVQDAEMAAAALEAGADEVLTPLVSERESELRLRLALRRADRDVSVHPTTRLPGTVQIERDFGERLTSGEKFAVCYADLDHFKEYNDRYGYHEGDRVILMVSRILRDVVRAYSSSGFVGHIGGDDFIFSLPLVEMPACCETVLEVFDTLVPFQYDEADRDRGSFLGKDRRGNEYEVPLMSLSIGVVTNEQKELTHPAEISELATEMKTYAKTFPGSIYVVDRRGPDKPTND
jgi:diguanylate cyclase (GGDEF)-like protein